MAWIRRRTRSDGLVSIAVQWRDIRGKLQSETFRETDEAAANEFLRLVEGSGGDWPPRWVKGEGFPAAVSSVTVRAAALAWVASNTQASDRTRAEYRRSLDRYLPEGDPFGEWPAGLVKHSDVRKWIRRLQDRQVVTKRGDSADTLSAKTIRNVHTVVSAGFDLLLRDGDISSNPALGAAPSLGDKPNDHVLTVAEYRALLSYIPLHYRPLIETLVRTGSRWGEATALLVGDVNPDADNPRIRIDKAWTEGDRRGEYREGTPKTQRGYRSAAIDEALLATLAPLMVGRGRDEFLFTTATGRVVRHNNFYARIWAPAATTAFQSGELTFKPRIHDLRHAQATWLLESGVPVGEVARRLGHDPITLMRVYSHVLNPDTRASANVITRLLGSTEGVEVNTAIAAPRKSRAKPKGVKKTDRDAKGSSENPR
ncbi:MAG: site-specific integrase [Actinomycetota bacterium]|nr:site-specific integrase [Actinomycetota bacterium]